jgi:hypothetical protein
MRSQRIVLSRKVFRRVSLRLTRMCEGRGLRPGAQSTHSISTVRSAQSLSTSQIRFALLHSILASFRRKHPQTWEMTHLQFVVLSSKEFVG